MEFFAFLTKVYQRISSFFIVSSENVAGVSMQFPVEGPDVGHGLAQSGCKTEVDAEVMVEEIKPKYTVGQGKQE